MTEKRDRTAYYEEKLQKKVILATEQSLELQVYEYHALATKTIMQDNFS